MALLAVGSVALDSLQTPFGVREDVLGGSATYFSTAASFFAPVRVAVTGSKVSPPLFETIEILGRDLTLARLAAVLPG